MCFGPDGGEYWDDSVRTHSFECFFTDRDEAIAYAKTFTKDDAKWGMEHGNGVHFNHVGIDVLEMEHADEWYAGMAVFTRDWKYGKELEEWFDGDCVDHIMEGE